MTAIIALEDQPMTVCNRLKLQTEICKKTKLDSDIKKASM